MIENTAVGFWIVVGAYDAIGILLLVPFHLKALKVLDNQAEGSSWGFRILVTPGLVAFWPLVLLKWRAAAQGANPAGDQARPVAPIQIRRLQAVLMFAVVVVVPLVVALALGTRPAPLDVDAQPASAEDAR